MKYLKPLFILSLLGLVLFTSFKKKDKPEKLLPKEYRDLFSAVPEQILDIDFSYPIEFYKCQRDTSKEIIVESFYCSNTEVSNELYKSFLNDLKENNQVEKLNIAQFDSLKWLDNSNYGEPYVQIYHFHPAFDKYPAVNISYRGAELFCKWYEKKLNSASENGIKFSVNLPSRYEWITAAQGGSGFVPYPWGNAYFKNQKGDYLANFNPIGNESIHFNPETEELEIIDSFSFVHSGFDGAQTTASVDSYFPNDYGLHNMSGNVAEMISEEGIACGGGWRSTGFDIRCHSTMEYSEPQPDIGFRPIIKIVKD